MVVLQKTKHRLRDGSHEFGVRVMSGSDAAIFDCESHDAAEMFVVAVTEAINLYTTDAVEEKEMAETAA